MTKEAPTAEDLEDAIEVTESFLERARRGHPPLTVDERDAIELVIHALHDRIEGETEPSEPEDGEQGE